MTNDPTDHGDGDADESTDNRRSPSRRAFMTAAGASAGAITLGPSMAAAQEGPMVTVDLADETIAAGETATVDLGLSEAPNGLAGFDVELHVDSSVAMPVDAGTADGVPDDDDPVGEVVVEDDYVRLRAVESVEAGATDVDFGSVELEGIAMGETALEVEIVRLEEADATLIEPPVESATLTVDDGPEESPTVAVDLADDELAVDGTTTATIGVENVPVGSSGVDATIAVDPDVAAITDFETTDHVPSTFETGLRQDLEDAGGAVDELIIATYGEIEQSELELATYTIEGRDDGVTALTLADFALTPPDGPVIESAAYDAPTLTVGGGRSAADPDTPDSPAVLSTDGTSIEIGWSPDSNAVAYNVYVDGELETETASSSVTITGLGSETTYEIGVSAIAQDGDETDTATVTATTAAATGDVTLAVDREDNHIEPGETAIVRLLLPEVPTGLSEFDVELRVDPDVATPIDAATPAMAIDDAAAEGEVTVEDDRVRITGVNPVDPGSTDVELGHVELEGVSYGETELDVQINRLADESGDDVELEIDSATFLVSTDPTGLGPTLSVTPADSEIEAGETTTVHLWLSEAPDGLLGFDVELHVDATVVTPTDAGTTEEFPDDSDLLGEVTVADEYARLRAIETVDPGTVDILLGSVELEGATEGTAELEPEIVRLEDRDGNPLEIESRSSELTVREYDVDDGPGVPENLAVETTDDDSIDIEWTDDPSAAAYNVYVDGELATETAANSATISRLESGTTYEIGVSAVDEDGTETDVASITATTEIYTDVADEYPTWSSDERYERGDRVGWDGSVWEAERRTRDEEPGASQWGPWDEVETVDDTGDSEGSTDPVATVEPSATSVAVGERLAVRVVDASSPDVWITDLEWDFGDGTTASGWWDAHTYDSAGTYTVALTATDSEGRTTTHEVEITVS